MRHRSKSAQTWMLCAALGVAAACTEDGAPPAEATLAPAASTAAPADTGAAKDGAASAVVAAEAPQATAFSYSPVGRRDPFRSYLSQVKERRDAQSSDHRHEDTEDFEVHQYRLTGLITGTSRPKAMLDDPNGEAHLVHIGSRVGKNGGRVTTIGPHGLTVQEETVDASGKAVSVPINVRLLDDVLDNVAPEE